VDYPLRARRPARTFANKGTFILMSDDYKRPQMARCAPDEVNDALDSCGPEGCHHCHQEKGYACRACILAAEVVALRNHVVELVEQSEDRGRRLLLALGERDEARAALSDIADISAEPATVAKARQGIHDSCPPKTFQSTFDAG